MNENLSTSFVPRASTWAADSAPPTLEARGAAARALGQMITVAALYGAAHPVSQRAVEDAHAALARCLRGERPLVLSAGPAGWLLDGSEVRNLAIPPTLGLLFKDHDWKALACWPGVGASELGALCELAATTPDPRPGAAQDFLRSRGVRRVTLGVQPAEEAPAQPIKPPATEAGRQPFTSFLHSLVERSGATPPEQEKLYNDALELLRAGMREAMETQIAAAQAQLEQQARQLVAECQRTQRVLASVAEGRVTVDADGRVLMMNAAAENIAGRPLRELAGRSLTEGVAPDDQILAMTLPDGRAGSAAPRFVMRGAQENYDSLRRSMALVCDSDGKVVGTYGVLPHAARAKEAARQQEDFLSRVTHELKAPLTAITAALELLDMRTGKDLGETERSLLDASHRNTGKLRKLIDDLLDFASLEQGELQLRLDRCEPSDLVADSVASLQPWAESKKILLTINHDHPSPPPVRADPERIGQVLTNLLSNALKVTPEGGSVAAGARAEPGCVRFWVGDTGCGIAPEDQKRIFEKFVQVRPDGGTREGVGLGLAIVSDLVRRHGGRIDLESAPGRGSVFSFTVPLA